MSISLLLGGCGSSPDLKASSISEGGGVIDASGKVVSGDSSDSEKAGSSGKKKKLKKKAGSNSDNSDSSGSPEAAPAAGEEETSDTVSDTAAEETVGDTAEEVPEETANDGPGSRDNTPVILVPEQPGTEVYGNELVTIDASHSDQGYISVMYSGSSPKVKLQITCPNTTTYTYNITAGGYEVFPLTVDSGTYSIGAYENISGSEYSTCFRTDISVNIANEFGPYLYPNQYVNFNAGSQCIAVAEELAYSANTDLDVVSSVYNYLIENVTYDSALANSVESGYLPDPDRTLNSCTGICLDYACLMSSMLRSQGIPTHLEVGYASTAYHAWISVYLTDVGWVNGIVEFNGTSWELMDPTFAASASADELREFIGDGSNYETKYIY